MKYFCPSTFSFTKRILITIPICLFFWGFFFNVGRPKVLSCNPVYRLLIFSKSVRPWCAFDGTAEQARGTLTYAALLCLRKELILISRAGARRHRKCVRVQCVTVCVCVFVCASGSPLAPALHTSSVCFFFLPPSPLPPLAVFTN